jgi:hypothetical protein
MSPVVARLIVAVLGLCAGIGAWIAVLVLLAGR